MTTTPNAPSEHSADANPAGHPAIPPIDQGSRGAFLIGFLVLFLLCLRGGFFGFIGEQTLLLPGPWNESGVFPIPGGWFILLFGLTWVGCLALLILFPRGLDRGPQRALILGCALLLRLALLPHEPSDDINRYLWEGRLVNLGISPYHHAPIEAPDNPTLVDIARNDPYYPYINHPENPAAYPPFLIYLFALVIRIGYAPIAVKLMAILFDLGALYFLLRLLEHRRLAGRWAILYACNPVILYSFAGQGHFDAIQNFFLLAAVFAYDRRRWGWTFLCLGLAVQTKYVAILTLPFFLRRDNLAYSGIALSAMVLPFLPFLGTDPGRIFQCLFKFGAQYAFNGPIHAPLRALFEGDMVPATRICAGLLAGALLFGCFFFHPRRGNRFRNDPVSGCFFALGALLLLSPTVHFWYLSWVVPFLALRPFASWTLLCLTIGGYFIANGVMHHTGEWRLPAWGQAAEWLPFWILLLRDGFLFGKRMDAPPPEHPPKAVSVVIPARNEADRIAACVATVRRDPAVEEVIVADGGSSDETPVLAEAAGARVIRHIAPPEKGGGRGGQISAGIRIARGDVVAVVHADTLVSAPAFTRMLQMLRVQPMIVGGAVGGVFSGGGWRLRPLEWANDLRAAFLGISFGDQVQFFRRQPVIDKGVFPDIPLMEDVELGLQLQRLGRQTYFFGSAVISDRRWRGSVSRRTGLILGLFAAYLWKRLWGRPDTPAMHRIYYGDRRDPDPNDSLD